MTLTGTIICVIFVAFGIGAFYVAHTERKIAEIEKEKQEETIKREEWVKYNEANKEKESMETGNGASDVDASIELLHKYAQKGTTAR